MSDYPRIDLHALRKKLRRIDHLLEGHYGAPAPKKVRDPLATLVRTILSQNTSDRNSHRAYKAMRQAFPTWEDVMAAPQSDLAHALRPGGLAQTKSARIQRVLGSIANRAGRPSLDFLNAVPSDKAERFLLGLDGVGLKTARCVLLFGLGRDVFPIDTHIHRVLKRLGIIPERMSAEKAHKYVPPLIADGRCWSLHVSLITHGRTTCHARSPQCPSCFLRRHCRFYAAASGKARGTVGVSVPK